MRFHALLAALVIAPFAHAEPLKAGFGSADITPVVGPKPVYLAGFGSNRQATAIHDPIMVRAVVFNDGKQTIAIASVDVVGLFLPVVEHCRKRLPGINHLTVSATHNHEGPDTLGLWGRTPFQSGTDPAYLKRLEDGVVAAVNAAVGDMQPCDAEIGSAVAPELVADNRLPEVKLDTLVAVRFRDPATRAKRGVLVQWNSHPETLGSNNTAISADFVGHAVRAASKIEGCPVVYLTGAVGGLMTSLGVTVNGPDGKPLPRDSHEQVTEYGKLVADKIGAALNACKPVTLTPFTVRTRAIRMPVENPLYKLAWQVKVIDRPAFTFDPAHADAGLPTTDITKPAALASEVGYWRLGQLGIAMIPGEIYPELVLGRVVTPAEPGADYPDVPAEPAIYPAMPTEYKMVIGLANDELGYVIPKRQWDTRKPYCYGREKPQYGEENSVGPDAARVICGAFARLTRP